MKKEYLNGKPITAKNPKFFDCVISALHSLLCPIQVRYTMPFDGSLWGERGRAAGKVT